MKRKLVQANRSVLIALPKAYLELIGMEAGQEVELTINQAKKEIIIKRA